MPEPAGEKAYNLLFAALKETGRAAIGWFAMHGREHVAAIRAGGESLVLHSLFYANEVTQPAFRAGAPEGNPKELELAKTLVHALEAKFDPGKWKDRYEERLKALIESRAPVSAPPARQAAAPAADITEALRKSLERIRKPAAQEQRPTQSKRKRHAGG